MPYLGLFLITTLTAAGGNAELSGLLLGLSVVLVAAKIGGDLAIRIGQPEVLGELVIGVVVGNLGLIGLGIFDPLKLNHSLAILAELGVILLLFEVGLETSIGDMMKVGMSSLIAALLGVVAPFFLGMFCSMFFAPDLPTLVHVFVGATLTATSVGITARVLKDIGKIRSDEGKIILGAAVIDDVLGLLVLAVVQGIIVASNKGESLAILSILKILVTAVGFLGLAVALGGKISPHLFKAATYLRSHGILLAVSLSICFAVAYLAGVAGLAPIVGAFAAGLILEPIHYEELAAKDHVEHEIDELLHPIAALLVPVFFVSMGMKVDITVFTRVEILNYAFWLTVVAIIGKQVCAYGVKIPTVDKVVVGLGMIPRGEVGLIFAGIGTGLTLNGAPVIDSSTFGAVIIMVIVTTMVTPPAIKWRFANSPYHQDGEPSVEVGESILPEGVDENVEDEEPVNVSEVVAEDGELPQHP